MGFVEDHEMSWLQKLLPPKIKRSAGNGKKVVPEGLWVKCDACEAVLYRTDLDNQQNVCPKCNHHMRVTARERLDYLLDDGGPLRNRGRGVAARQPQVQGQPALYRAPRRGPGGDRRAGRAGRHAGEHQDHPAGRCCLRVPLHGRVHGIRGRRALCARGARLHRAGACPSCASARAAAHACRKR